MNGRGLGRTLLYVICFDLCPLIPTLEVATFVVGECEEVKIKEVKSEKLKWCVKTEMRCQLAAPKLSQCLTSHVTVERGTYYATRLPSTLYF